MKKYLHKLLRLSISLLVIMTVVDYAYSYIIRKSNYELVESWEELMEGKISADIVALGSSRTFVQVVPEILDSVSGVNSYNLGMDGSHINRQVLKYELFRQRNTKPKVIVQNIDAFTMSYKIGYGMEQFFPYFWYPDVRRTFFPSEPFSFGDKYIPMYRYHGYNPEMFVHRYPRSLRKGYSERNYKWDGRAYNLQKAIVFKSSDTTLCMFDRYLRKAKEEDVQVIFVYAPLYYGATEKIINIDEMYSLYQSLADKYEIPILDYSDMWICHDTTYFYNAMHLNKTGAEIFTDSLANDIKRLGVIDNHGL